MDTLSTNGLWDSDTGEVVGGGKLPFVRAREKLVNNTDKPILAVYEVPPNQTVGSRAKKKPLEKSKETFGMFSVPMLRQVMTSLDINERAALQSLSLCLDYDNPLQYEDEKGRKQPLTVGLFQKLMGWGSKATVDKVLDSLEAKGLVLRINAGRSKFLELNPTYYYQGRQDRRAKHIEAFYARLEQARKAA